MACLIPSISRLSLLALLLPSLLPPAFAAGPERGFRPPGSPSEHPPPNIGVQPHPVGSPPQEGPSPPFSNPGKPASGYPLNNVQLSQLILARIGRSPWSGGQSQGTDRVHHQPLPAIHHLIQRARHADCRCFEHSRLKLKRCCIVARSSSHRRTQRHSGLRDLPGLHLHLSAYHNRPVYLYLLG
jgi:hypothetical protein